jgi:uncharacterized protein YndB with AHSA1/START domain
MSVKKDAAGRRWVEIETEVPGTPEEVWEAIATSSGVSSWFVPTEVVAGDAGTPTKVVSHFGPGMDAIAAVTAWDPPRRFAAESELAPGAPAFATEWIVEARGGGTCVVRVVHSLFASSADWDDQLEGTESGWPWFFRILRIYLRRFRGEPCSQFRMMAFSSRPASEAWSALIGGLGLSGSAPGARANTGTGVPSLSGTVEAIGEGAHPHRLLLRLDEPAPGIASIAAHGMGGQTCLMIDVYLYGHRAAAAAGRAEPLWQAWMKQQFPAVDAPTGVA